MFLWMMAACTGGDDSGSALKETGSSVVSEECQVYLDCAFAVLDGYGEDAGFTREDVEDAYGEEGSCWDDPAYAEDCNAACSMAIDTLADAFWEIPECGGHPTASATWNGSGINVTASSHDAGWDFGMAETGSSTGWGGEDCLTEVPAGHSNVSDYGYSLCHRLGPTGGRLDSVGDLGDVHEGATTLFSQSVQAGITYVLLIADGDTCVTWGDDPTYYEALGCTEL